MAEFDAIVLAGGASRRLGRNKALVRLRGVTLLERTCVAVAGARRIAVVAPKETIAAAFAHIPGNVVQTLEDPPLGGPVAGLIAGLDALGEPRAQIAVLSCDVPRAADAIEVLLGRPLEGAGVCAVDGTGRQQLLVGVYSFEFLNSRRAAVGSGHGASIRAFMDGGAIEGIMVPPGVTDDVDTPLDLQCLSASE
ncbi:MAG: NTP transferase domain-containing protein [Ancrocorticia sp.]|jgi:molybdopterin-guanine dinucleotide biosynthesis protein A|nr:NTP transferase domain-containing protein [Ancrocorticia sp.]MCI1896602.1 NTP transferase domain-containing protein [Ancrocorticia sp.]MCI1933222.1 NTP transferase domain-containing protein [Ancrocorticia sp.]MCI1964391.1 NTP transferase domain-containing protein [Ancrocorticia sp.]MCI2002994.1 NTP transferase domain-containing protein [Ancrocorticia sp.]